jgi:hypothetical protein
MQIGEVEAGDAPAIVSLLYESFVEYRSLYTRDGNRLIGG